jgi:hypothetical protein
MSDHLISDSLAAALTYSATGQPAAIAGAAAAGRMLGILATHSTRTDAMDWATIAATYSAAKVEAGWPVAEFMTAFRSQCLLGDQARQL